MIIWRTHIIYNKLGKTNQLNHADIGGEGRVKASVGRVYVYVNKNLWNTISKRYAFMLKPN